MFEARAPALRSLLVALLITLAANAGAQGGVALNDPVAFAPPPPTPPLFDPPRGEQRIVVFGDFNGPYGALDYPAPVARVLAAITEVWRPDLLLSPGDVIAGQSRELSAARLAAMWQAFDASVAAPLRSAGVPYAFAVGNHDASNLRAKGAALFPRDRAAAAEYWGQEMYGTNLAYLDREDFPFNYSFRHGEAFIAVIDASSATVSDEQRRWLNEALAGNAARSARLRIVVGHLPLVAVGEGRDGPGETIVAAPALTQLLIRRQVDLYVSGHHAAYYPGTLGELELLFAGGIGARRLLGDERPARSTVTLIDIWHEPLQLVYTTFDAATFARIEARDLPAELATGVKLSARSGPPRAGPAAGPGD